MARRFKVATVLNFVGLVAALATFYLLMTQVAYQRTFNHGVKDYQRLYRIETDYIYKEWSYSEHVCRSLADALNHLSDVVETYSLTYNYEQAAFPFLRGDREVKYTFNQGNNTAVSALTGKAVSGSIEWSDDSIDGIIIPASIAMDYFGTTQAADSVMLLLYYLPDQTACDTIPMTVRGVYQDFPENSELDNCIYQCFGPAVTLNFDYLYKCYVKFKDRPEDLEAIAGRLKRALIDDIKQSPMDESVKQAQIQNITSGRIKFTPLGDSYFEHASFSTGKSGYKGMLFILELASLLVIIIAAINFLNFTLAESPMRVRGINTRLVLGASRRSLRLGMCAECVVVSLIAGLTALAVCHVLTRLPALALLMEGDITLCNHWALAALTMALALMVGIAAGAYPAIFATSFAPAVALKASFGLTPVGLRLRTTLMTVQLFVSMLMVCYLGILLMQSHYIFSSTYGFNKDQVLVGKVIGDETMRQQMRRELMRLPGIESVSFSNVPLGTTDAHNVIMTTHDGHPFEYNLLWIDSRFMSTMGIHIIEGRDFLPTDTSAMIITRTARDQWDWVKLGTNLSANPEDVEGDSAMVIGVCEDIRYGTMRTLGGQPYCFMMKKSYDYLYNVNVRLAAEADVDHTRGLAQEVLTRFNNGQAVELTPYDETLASTYHNELRFFQLITVIAIIDLVITLIGVFCMTLFETEYRRKEIGIRKVAGATPHEIVWMLCRRYGWLILISFVAAMPIAHYFGKRTLEYFAEHTSIHWWIFALALLATGGITLGTVALQSWRAARENPTASIKTE